MIAIFSTELEAVAYANKIHQYLLANRPQYNAEIWSIPEQSADGLTWFVKAPVEHDDNRWGVPVSNVTELTKAIDTTALLPSLGGLCTKDKYYLYKGDVVKCRQTHNRAIYEPKDTPALFSFFRNNTNQLEWIEGEQVQVGWMRIYNGVKYEVIQAHQTQSDWTPNVAITLWKGYIDPDLTAEWKTGVGYKVGNKVIYQTKTYTCLQAHTSIISWNPVATINILWKLN